MQTLDAWRKNLRNVNQCKNWLNVVKRLAAYQGIRDL